MMRLRPKIYRAARVAPTAQEMSEPPLKGALFPGVLSRSRSTPSNYWSTAHCAGVCSKSVRVISVISVARSIVAPPAETTDAHRDFHTVDELLSGGRFRGSRRITGRQSHHVALLRGDIGLPPRHRLLQPLALRREAGGDV